MKAAALKYTFLSWAANLAAVIIALVPFHAFLTVWLSSFVGHYTALRLWKEALLVVIMGAVFFLLLTDHKIRSHTLTRRLVWVIVGYGGLQALAGLYSLHAGQVTPKAMAYGLLVNLRFLGFFLLVWAIALRTSRLKASWQRLVLWPAVVVIVFGLLQIAVLPADWLRHVGYGSTTIMPFETVNSNRGFVRIASTLRGPNPLGAYLVLVLTAVLVVLLRAQKKWRLAALMTGGLIVLGFSFSRSAALGAVTSLLIVVAISARADQAKKLLAIAGIGLAVLALIGVAVVHKSTQLENIVLHTQTKSSVSTSSNGGHLASLRQASRDIVHQPLGRGPGTAGPASVYNAPAAPRIAENYFLQIGQEVGIWGLGLFILINVGIGYLLWLRRADPLALTLFASFIGLTIVNLLSHAWADDTLAYVWWGLAGVAMASAASKDAKT